MSTENRIAVASAYGIDISGITAAACRAEISGLEPYVRVTAGVLSMLLDADIAWRLAKELGLAAISARRMAKDEAKA